MLSRLRKFLSYPAGHKVLLARIWMQSFRIDRLIDRDGLAVTQARLRDERFDVSQSVDLDHKELADLVGTATRYSIGMDQSCLRRSLLLWWLLRECGIQSELCVGIRKESGALKGHAWIEKDGVPLNDKPSVADEYSRIEVEEWRH